MTSTFGATPDATIYSVPAWGQRLYRFRDRALMILSEDRPESGKVFVVGVVSTFHLPHGWLAHGVSGQMAGREVARSMHRRSQCHESRRQDWPSFSSSLVRGRRQPHVRFQTHGTLDTLDWEGGVVEKVCAFRLFMGIPCRARGCLSGFSLRRHLVRRAVGAGMDVYIPRCGQQFNVAA